MDPWGSNESSPCEVENQPTNDVTTISFEDNFHFTKPEYAPLSDSKDYLKSLESKLAKIKADPRILEQLQQKHADCMNNLLRSDKDPLEDEANLQLDEPIEESSILRAVCPQKQALTVSEQVHLIQHDLLQQNFESELTRRRSDLSM